MATGNEQNLIWIDLEMTGLDPTHDRIIEIAITLIIESPELASTLILLASLSTSALSSSSRLWGRQLVCFFKGALENLGRPRRIGSERTMSSI